MGEPAGSGEARGTIAGPHCAICSSRPVLSLTECSLSECPLSELLVHWQGRCDFTLFPRVLHEQACPTSRCGLHRLGGDPSVDTVECIYCTQQLDVAAVRLLQHLDVAAAGPQPE